MLRKRLQPARKPERHARKHDAEAVQASQQHGRDAMASAALFGISDDWGTDQACLNLEARMTRL